MNLILAFILAWISTLSGVALGGFLVYRTKRENYDQLFSKPPQGDAFNTDSGFGFEDLLNQDQTRTEIPKPMAAAEDRFTEQFAESLAERARQQQTRKETG